MKELIGVMTELVRNPFKGWNKLRTRHLLLVLGTLFSITVYYYLVDFYGADFSVFSYLRFNNPPTFTFHSGSERLSYYQIGKYLAENPHKSAKVLITANIETKGGYENAKSVLTSAKPSLGVVQEDILRSNDFIREHLNFAAPLYLERMHIIYNKKKFGEFIHSLKGSQPLSMSNVGQLFNQPQISSYTHPAILRYFAASKISIGPIGSGTRIIGSYIVENINEQVKALEPNGDVVKFGQEILNLNFESGIDRLENDDLDILFIMTGSPCESISDLIVQKADRFGLISVEPTLTDALNVKHQTNLRSTDFKDRYTTNGKHYYDEVSTLGTYAYLVADKKTQYIDLLSVLEILNEAKGNKAHPLARILNGEFDFLEYYRKQSYGRLALSLRSLLVFLVTVCTAYTASFVFLSWFISTRRQEKYLEVLARVVDENLPNNEEYDTKESADSYLIPLVQRDQTLIVNKIIKGLNRLSELRKEISQDRGVDDAHTTFLIGRIDQIVEKLRKNLGIRLNEVIERGDGEINETTLRKYFTADWITKDDYTWLASKSHLLAGK